MTRPAPPALLLLLAVAATAQAAGEIPARDFAVRAGRILTMTGEDLAPGVVVVRDGRFAAVGGPDTRVPEGLPVVDASSRVLMPGFIEAHSQRGLDRAFESAADASFVRVTDGFNPVSLEVEDARRNGITTLLVAPDDRGFLAGRAAILHPQGLSVDSMIVKQDAGLKISLAPSPGSSRMGHVARLREILSETRRWIDERRAEGLPIGDEPRRGRPLAAEPARPGRGSDGVEVEARREALVSLLEARMPAYVFCPTAADVSAAFALAADHGFHVVPVLGPGAWRAAPLLKSNAVSVVVTPVMETWERQPDGTLLHVSLPRVLHDAGVPFALTTDPFEMAAQHPWYQAALAVRAGVPRDTALAAITTVPARILGFGDRKGVIAEGADADFLLLSDDPLSAAAWVEEAYVRGARIYERTADAQLQRLQQATSEPPMTAAEIDHREDDRVEVEAQRLDPAGPAERERGQRWPPSRQDEEPHHP